MNTQDFVKREIGRNKKIKIWCNSKFFSKKVIFNSIGLDIALSGKMLFYSILDRRHKPEYNDYSGNIYCQNYKEVCEKCVFLVDLCKLMAEDKVDPSFFMDKSDFEFLQKQAMVEKIAKELEYL